MNSKDIDSDISNLLSSIRAELQIATQVRLLGRARDALTSLPKPDKSKIFRYIFLLQAGSTEGLRIKILQGKIKEIVVKRYRLIFFEKNNVIYLIDMFKKQSQKTPQRIISRAEKIYELT